MLSDIHSHVYVICSLEQSFVASTQNEMYLGFKSRRWIIVQNIKLFVHVDHKNVWSSYFVCYRLFTFLYTKKWIDCISRPSLNEAHNASPNVIVHHSIDILLLISHCILTNLSSCNISYSRSIISWSITSRSNSINSFTREF